MVNVTKRNAPALRFDGFDDEWVPQTMRNCGEYSKGSGYSKKDLSGEGTPVIHYGRLYTNYETAITNVDTFAHPQPGSVVSRGVEVLVPASGETAEDIAIASALLQPGVLIGGDLNVIRPIANIDPVFLALSLSSGTAKETLVKRAQGKSVVHLRNSDIQEVEVSFPPAPKEQRAIGELFAALDALIEQHRAKHANLQQTKTALMQRLFPQDGADEPELRLDGFNGAWATLPLGDLGTSYGGLTGKTKEDFGHGDARYITYLDVFERALIDDGSRLGATDIDNRQNEVKTGDVLFTVSSEVPDEVGMSAVWLGQGQNIYLNSFCFGFRPTAGLDSKFLAYVLRSPDFRKKMTLLAQGISRFNISKTRAMELEISVPTIEEQRAIGEVFTSLDALIAAEQRYITQLAQAKTALLQRMFV